MPDVAGAEMHLALVHDICPEAHRFPAEGARVDEACRRAELGVLHVMVDELEPVHGAELELRRQRIAPIGARREFSFPPRFRIAKPKVSGAPATIAN